MSTAVKQFHEEEAIGKTYDLGIARRLLRYLRPYVRVLVPTLLLTLVLNALRITQPKFTQYAIDLHIVPRQLGALDGREAVRDDDGCAVAHHALNRLLN